MRPESTRRERFESLYRAHYSAVARYAARRVGAPQSEDVAAETFAVAWRRLDAIPTGKTLPWLLGVAHKKLAEQRRENASQQTKADSAALVLTTAGRDPGDAFGEREAISAAFARLSAADREALALVAWDGLTLADGARVVGVSRLAFAARVSRARRRLQAALADPDHVSPLANRLERTPS